MPDTFADVHGLAVVETATGTITQKELESLKRQVEEAKTRAATVKALRADIEARFERGEKVEPGRYDVRTELEAGDRSWSSIVKKLLTRVVDATTHQPITYEVLLKETKPKDVSRCRVIDTEQGKAV